MGASSVYLFICCCFIWSLVCSFVYQIFTDYLFCARTGIGDCEMTEVFLSL